MWTCNAVAIKGEMLMGNVENINNICKMWTVLLGVLSVVLLVLADLEVCLKDQGCLEGTIMPGYRGETFEAFMGIPYAEPPIGELRFKDPVAAAPWEEVLSVGVPEHACIQKCYLFPNFPVFGVEDCLYLNVYRPVVPEDTILPVMVYFHSGGFFCGSSDFFTVGPEYLMDTKQVILVTLNYRLGPFGFLSTGDRHMSGNFGLKDQRLALQWVQKHIAAFGGDPQLVTIFGHSAGGMSAHFHMLSPSSKDLFQRAISLSGTALSSLVHVKNPLPQVRQLAEQLGIPESSTLDTEQLTQALREVDAFKLLEAGDIFKVWNNLPLVNFGVVVEQDNTTDAFLTEDCTEAHIAGRLHQVPWLLGSSSRAGEGALLLIHILTNPQLRQEFNENFLKYFQLALFLPESTTIDTVQELLELYDVKELELNEQTVVQLSNIIGDFIFYYPLYVTAEQYVKYAEKSVSIYKYEYRSPSNIYFSKIHSEGIVPPELLPAHMDDALHTIRMLIVLPEFPKDSEDHRVIKRLTSLLVDFAKTGVFYNETELPACKPEDFTSEGICKYLNFGQENGEYRESIEGSMDLRGLSLWKKLYL